MRRRYDEPSGNKTETADIQHTSADSSDTFILAVQRYNIQPWRATAPFPGLVDMGTQNEHRRRLINGYSVHVYRMELYRPLSLACLGLIPDNWRADRQISLRLDMPIWLRSRPDELHPT